MLPTGWQRLDETQSPETARMHRTVRRRGCYVAPRGARAAADEAVIGFLSSRSPNDSTHLVIAFQRGLKEHGCVEDQNVMFEYRWADSNCDRLPELAANLAQALPRCHWTVCCRLQQ
jgi:hypothetical protein